MRYKVSFRKRFDAEGNPFDHPVQSLSLPDGVVQEALISELEDPPAMHVQENMDEDDNFLSLGVEVWEFEVTAGREGEFVHAVENSRTALEYEEINPADEAA